MTLKTLNLIIRRTLVVYNKMNKIIIIKKLNDNNKTHAPQWVIRYCASEVLQCFVEVPDHWAPPSLPNHSG